MNELIKIESKNGIETVNARELHEFLEVNTRFNDWIKLRIDKYEFVENIDYILLTEKIVSGNNANSKSYYISLDMAKELSMVENNQKGKEARLYFIEREKQAKQLVINNVKIMSMIEDMKKDIADIKKLQTYKLATPKKEKRIKTNSPEITFQDKNMMKVNHHDVRYLIAPSYYGDHKWDIRLDTSDKYPPSIKKGLLSQMNAYKYIERNL